MANIVDNLDYREIRNLYENKGLTFKEIGLRFGCTAGPIRKIAKRHKFKIQRGKSSLRKILVQKAELPLSASETNIHSLIPDLSDVAIEIILGAILGDSNFKKREYKSKDSYYVCFGHSVTQLGYLEYKHNLMKDYVNSIRKEKTNPISVIRGKEYHRKDFYAFSTKPLNLKFIYDEMIIERPNDKNLKIVSEKVLSYLTPLSLAIWYMDDGSYHQTNRTVRFCTQGFSVKDNYKLVKYFQTKLKLPCFLEKTNDGSGVMLILAQNASRKLLDLIRPYKTECMEYKFAINPVETLKAENNSVSKGVDDLNPITLNIFAKKMMV